VIHNGIDTEQYKPDHGTDVLEAYGVDPDRPSVIFVGRITRQKGVMHLLRAAEQLPEEFGLVLCAGAADTPGERQQVADAVTAMQSRRSGVVWIEEMLPREKLVPLITGATVFVVPSVYEPLGIVNLEAMACETAVVATDTGGIPEVVADGETGLLVPFESDGAGGPRDPVGFAADIAERVNRLLADPGLARRMGGAGRRRAVEEFSWTTIAAETAALYAELVPGAGGAP
jgi:starch synthase